MADVITAMDTRVFIGPAVDSSVDTLQAFIDLDTGGAFVEIELVEQLGPYGDSSNSVTFNAYKDARVRKAKGSRNAGTPELAVGYDYEDPGQAALRAAEESTDKFAIKVILPNKGGPTGDGQIDYFRALVMSAPKDLGTTDAVVRQRFQLDLDSKVFTVPPTAGS